MSNPQHNNGGPVFPFWNSDTESQYYGMSLRDYFAGQALNGMLSDAKTIEGIERLRGKLSQAQYIAQICFNISDAMLKAREAKS